MSGETRMHPSVQSVLFALQHFWIVHFWQLFMFRGNETASSKETCPSCIGICPESACPMCVKPALLLSEQLCALWIHSPQSLHMYRCSLLLLVRIEKTSPTLCFVATFCFVTPHGEFLVVADNSLELRWNFSRTEEHFCWQKSEMEANMRKVGTQKEERVAVALRGELIMKIQK